MRELFVNADDELIFEADIQKLLKAEEKDKKQMLANWVRDFKLTFCDTAHGRRVLWWLIHETYIFRNFGEHNASAYAKEGKRELAQDIIDVIGATKMLESLILVANEKLEEEVKKDE